jgi:hypothetical protein
MPLTDFSKFIKDFTSLPAVAAKGGAAAPLLDYLVKIGPPWPPYAIPAATSLVELICLVCIFQFLVKKEIEKLNQYIIISLIMFCFFTFAYLWVFSTYTFRHPKTGELVVKGCILTPNSEQVIKPDFTVEDALKGNQYEPEGIWTSSSLTIMRLILVGFWVLMFISLSSFFGTFVIVQQKT